MQITSSLTEAKKILMTYWPLNSFIATNPLWSLRHHNFFDAICKPGIHGIMPIDYYHAQYQAGSISTAALKLAIEQYESKSLNDQALAKWIRQSLSQHAQQERPILFSEQVEEYQFQETTTWIKEKVYILLINYFGRKAYQKNTLLAFWQQQSDINKDIQDQLKNQSTLQAIEYLLKKLHIPTELHVDYLQAIYLKIYGWSSFMHWRNQHPNNPWIPGQDACEIILLMWLSVEYSIAIDLGISFQKETKNPAYTGNKAASKALQIWQTAFELHYLNHLNSQINSTFGDSKTAYDAQFIFCIDTRSEGFRRHLENQGNIQTFGFAGFFGAIFNLNDGDRISYQAPALVAANHTVTLKKNISFLTQIKLSFQKVINASKKQLTAPFALFEMVGFLFLPFMLFKTLQPTLNQKCQHDHIEKIDNPFSSQEKFDAAHSLLKGIGLVKNFSAHVLICAHQADNINNPFKSALNCGACGGNSGVPNAIIMCDILNDPCIRARLSEVNICIPQHTRFIPACHHTGNDRLSILRDEIPATLSTMIDSAAEHLRAEKRQDLPGISSLKKRESNWSELIPELGLINNTCIVIGPRALTQGHDLQRRAFLHSYDPDLDDNGDILTGILSAPAIVAHWISSQYFFSTVNPTQFGAGNKAIHNVLPGIGVLEGNLSDLKIGLPLQSTHFRSRPMHEPRRIIVVVYAKKHILEKAIRQSADFKTLLDNEWLHLQHYPCE